MEHRRYFDRLQIKIGETKSADRIIEGPWWDIVMRELNQTSLELQTETGKPYSKYYTDGTHAYDLS